MPEFLTTRELAELLRIKERKVYDLAASGAIPCSKAMGKLLFPRDAIDAWLAESATGQSATGAQTHAKAVPGNVFLGSHDPLLEWALRESRCGIATYFDGSTDGLVRFARREGVATGLHLQDESGSDWNIGAVKRLCPAMPVVLVEWAKRSRGLIVREALRGRIRSIADLKGRTVVPRQEEAGAQKLLLRLLAEREMSTDDMRLAAPARTEQDAALAVREGKADAALGLRALASQYGLPFVPVQVERFDILADRRAWFEPPMQKFLAFCRTDAFVRRAGGLDGYDIAGAGTVHFNGP